jgi:hypothetical protein
VPLSRVIDFALKGLILVAVLGIGSTWVLQKGQSYMQGARAAPDAREARHVAALVSDEFKDRKSGKAPLLAMADDAEELESDALEPAEELPEALKPLKASCDGGERSACVDLAKKLAEGVEGMAPNRHRAELYLADQCREAYKPACRELRMIAADLHSREHDLVGSEGLLSRICDMGDPLACSRLFDVHFGLMQRGKSIELSAARAFEQLKRICHARFVDEKSLCSDARRRFRMMLKGNDGPSGLSDVTRRQLLAEMDKRDKEGSYRRQERIAWID